MKAKQESQSISLVASKEALISWGGRADTAEQHSGALIVEYRSFRDGLNAHPGQMCYAKDPAWEKQTLKCGIGPSGWMRLRILPLQSPLETVETVCFLIWGKWACWIEYIRRPEDSILENISFTEAIKNAVVEGA